MTKKRQPEFDYSGTFDRLMGEQFGEEFQTTWNLFAGSWGAFTTVRKNGKRLTKQHALYGQGLSNGMAAKS